MEGEFAPYRDHARQHLVENQGHHQDVQKLTEVVATDMEELKAQVDAQDDDHLPHQSHSIQDLDLIHDLLDLSNVEDTNHEQLAPLPTRVVAIQDQDHILQQAQDHLAITQGEHKIAVVQSTKSHSPLRL